MFDDKSQTDLNAFFLYTLIQASIILKDDNLKNDTLKSVDLLKNKLSKKIYHCYENNEVDVFVEDYVYYALLLISLYEINGSESNLTSTENIMKEIWNVFFDKKTELLQKTLLKITTYLLIQLT